MKCPYEQKVTDGEYVVIMTEKLSAVCVLSFAVDINSWVWERKQL